MKNKRKLLSILLCICIFMSGCTNIKDFMNKIENYDSQLAEKDEFTEEDLKVQKEFDSYMNELFVDIMSDNIVTTHFSLEHPEDFGINFETADWGEEISAENIEKSYEEDKAILNRLDAIDKTSLTLKQQLTYQTVYETVKLSYASRDYYLYDELFSPIKGIQSEIPVIFSEYDFLEEKDIDNYLTLLESFFDYVKNIMDYEIYRAKKGYFLTDDGADIVIEQCEEFLEPEENCLVSIFKDKLTKFGITGDKYDRYMARFNTALETNVIPAYKYIIENMKNLKGSRKTQNGLAMYDTGSDYYEILVRQYTGSDKSVDELITIIDDSITDNLATCLRLYYEDAQIEEKFLDYKYPCTEPKEIVEYQIEKMKDKFPDIGALNYQIKNVPESLEATMSPAFYLVPPIDNIDRNIIYINGYDEYEHMNLFTTLAHEGAPGHMYQNYYFGQTNPDPIRTVMSFNGYCEGWATYVEHYSYSLSGMDPNLCTYATAMDAYQFGLYCRIDIGLHYEGWTFEDCCSYLSDFGIMEEDMVKEIYDTLMEDPGVYLQYFVGYLEILELKEKAEDKLGKLNEKEFHKFLLETGPTYFDIIDDNMNIWISEQNTL